MGRDHCFILKHDRAKFRIFRVFGFGSKGAKSFCVIGDHLIDVLLVEVGTGQPIQLVVLFLMVCIKIGGWCHPQESANGFMLADIFVCSATIFWAKALTAGLVAFASAN